MERVLMHMCCGPCSIYPLKELLAGEVEVTGFFYNPNIHPQAEFLKRLEAARKLAAHLDLEAVFFDRYEPRAYFDCLYGTDKKSIPKNVRCASCYALRLEKTALTAKALDYEYFSTTLLYSRYQMHDEILAIGNEIAARVGIKFLYRDFRSGWYEGKKLAKEAGLYRQKYCGCIFSLTEK